MSKVPDPDLTQQAMTRLRRIEGQVRGIQRLLGEQAEAPCDPCDNMLTQVLAVRAAVEQVGLLLLQLHLERCVLDGVPIDDERMRGLAESLRLWSRLS
jgi:DNA-binding FrmR family transcriptional regulator